VRASPWTGTSLQVTEFAYEYGTPEGPRQTQGNQFVHEGWRLFFGGLETVTLPSGETFEANYSPMEFAEPGESGFLTMQPLYDCGDMMSALDDTPSGPQADDRRVSQTGRLSGACLCGAVHIAIDGHYVAAVGACHCSMCQRSAGRSMRCPPCSPNFPLISVAYVAAIKNEGAECIVTSRDMP
jgi:hypothetical protein